MLDRASTFSDPEIVKMLKEKFIPVAIDQWYQRRQQDAEGEFYRKIASQGPRSDFTKTTQGRYLCTPAGELLGFNNNRGPERIRKLMRQALEEFDPATAIAAQVLEKTPLQYDTLPPKDGLIVRVHTKILGGYPPAEDWRIAFQQAIGRDNLWLKASEKKELAQAIQNDGQFPAGIASRIAKFHLVDNTRGEPPRWQASDIKKLHLELNDGRVTGVVHLETADGQRGFEAKILGFATSNGAEVTRFDLIAKGEFWGAGRYTQGAPEGKFPMAVAFRIGDGSDPSDLVLPHGAKGWIKGYFE